MDGNRFLIKCDICAAEFAIGKRFGDGYYVPYVYEHDLFSKLSAFFTDHNHLGQLDPAAPDCHDHFSSGYEHE